MSGRGRYAGQVSERGRSNKMALRLVGLSILVGCWTLISTQMYIDNGVDQTIIYRSLAVREKHEMQQELLHMLGLNHRPKPKEHTTERSAPRYLLDLYRSYVDFETGEIKLDADNATLDRSNVKAINASDVIMSFVNRIDHHAPHLRHDRDRKFWFDVSDVALGEEIMGAELRLYRNLTNSQLPTNFTYLMSLYSLIEGSTENGLQLVETITLSEEQDKWIVFNVTEPFVTWIAFPKKNLGLHLQIRSEELGASNISPDELGFVGRKGVSELQPFMVAFLQSVTDVHIRRTRSTKKRKPEDSSYNSNKDWLPNKGKRNAVNTMYPVKSCQRLAFYVSFKELKWQDWIIAPDGYAAFYCYGECSFPLTAHMNATNHAIVQTLVHLMQPELFPKPCCAPTRLSAVQVLYFDDSSNVVLKKYRKMIVQTCGCH